MSDGDLPTRSALPQVNDAPEPDAGTLNNVPDASIPYVAQPSFPNMNGFHQVPDPSLANMPLPANGTDPAMFTMPVQPGLSADEFALYDRQLRTWGVKVQENLRQANVLLIGLKALGTEIAKNLVLAGVGTLTVLDGDVVSEEDLGSQFLVNESHVGQNRAIAALPALQKLNPRVELYSDPNAAVTKDPEYFQSFDVTIATDLLIEVLVHINMSCRLSGRKFYAANTYGMYGFIFADLFVHDFIVEQEQSNKPPKVGDMVSSTRSVTGISSNKVNGKTTDTVFYQETYSPLQLVNLSPLPVKVRSTRRSRLRVSPLLSCIRALFDFQTQSGGRYPVHTQQDLGTFTKLVNEKHLELQLPTETLRAEFLRSFLQNLGAEISPVASFLGGFLAQDVINVLGQKEAPLQNVLLFDGEDFTASQYSIHPINDDAMTAIATNGGHGLPADSSIPAA
ncbi:hypothetical protein B0A52_05062 [Exophiala mesophila]|uniref:Ubiquitin-like 1-activating enzyme E1A n=1 Tax=Exophiala mesophila TaxID=212818 RepID=A0A438N6Y1_EXOME|nr:hypothetical protein B0A52_05062 [Exophiala mesophila]